MGNELVPRETWDISLSPWAVRLDSMDEGFALAMEIGENRADGERLVDIARRLGVKRGQLRMWLAVKPEREAAYSAGLEARAEEFVDDIIDIADTQEIGQTTSYGPNGLTVKTEDMLAHRALKIDARKWYAERAHRARWGSKEGVSVQAVGNITIIHQSE